MNKKIKLNNNKQFMSVMKDLLYKWAEDEKTPAAYKTVLVDAAEFTEDKIELINKQIAKEERKEIGKEILARSNDRKRKR